MSNIRSLLQSISNQKREVFFGVIGKFLLGKNFNFVWRAIPKKKIGALLVIAVFLSEQICWAGISDEFKSPRLPSLSSLKSTARSAVSKVQTTVSSARTVYNAATKISGAIQQKTGISPTKLDSLSNKIGLTKLTAGIVAGVITKKPQVVSQVANINLRETVTSAASSVSQSINNKWIALNDSFFKSSLVDHKKQALSLNPQGAEYKNYMSWMETNDPKVFAEVKTLEKQGLVGKKFSETYDGPMKGTAKAIDSLSVNKFSYRYAGDPEIGAPEVLGVAATFAEIPNGIGETVSWISGRKGDYQNWANNLGITKVYRSWKSNNVEKPLIVKYGNKYYQEMMKPEIEAFGMGISLIIPVGGGAGAVSKVSKLSELGNLISKVPAISRFSKGIRIAGELPSVGSLVGKGSGLLAKGGRLYDFTKWAMRPSTGRWATAKTAVKYVGLSFVPVTPQFWAASAGFTTYNYLNNSATVGNIQKSFIADFKIREAVGISIVENIASVPNGLAELVTWAIGKEESYKNLRGQYYDNTDLVKSLSKSYGDWKQQEVAAPLIGIYGKDKYNNVLQPGIETAGFVGSLFVPIAGEEKIIAKAGSIMRWAKGADFTIDVLKTAKNKPPILTLNSGLDSKWILNKLSKSYSFSKKTFYNSKFLANDAKTTFLRGSNFVLNSRPVVTYGKWVLAPAGVGVTGGFIYSYLSPYKSPAFNAYSHNQGEITKLMGKISLAQHISQPGSFDSNSYETAISDLSQAFPGETATSEKVSGYLAQNKEKYQDIKFDDPEIAGHLTQIVQLSNKNGELAGKFNTMEQVFMGLAEVNTIAVNGLANRINNLGIPYVGEFVKSVGSFTPLTGPSIGASVGSDPAQGFRGFADFFVNPIEAGIGLRRGSIVDRRWDYHPNYRNIGEAAGSAFILLGGGRQIKDTAGALKAKANTGYFSGINAAANSFLTANPKINNFLVRNPWVRPAVSHAVIMGPLTAAAFWQGWNNGDLGTPIASAAVLFTPTIVKGGLGKYSQQRLESAMGSMSVMKKTAEMDNAFNLLTKMAEEKGHNIMTDYALAGKTFKAMGDLKGEVFNVGPHSYTVLKSNLPAEYRLTPQLLTAKIGDSVYLIPNTIAFNSNSDDHKFKDKLSSFTNKISSVLKGGSNDLKQDFLKKSPIPVKSLFEDQVATLKSMVTSGINERLAVIRGLGTGKTTALLAYVLPYKMADNLKNGKATLILTPNEVVTNDVKAVLRGANDVGFNHKEIQQRLETNVIFPKKITEKELRIESVDRFEDKLKQEQDFVDKVMNNDVVVMPYELYSSIYHTYLMRSGPMDAVREKVTNRIKDSNFLMDEVDMPAFLPALMMSEGRKYVPEGNLEYDYWQDVAGKSQQIYDKAKYAKVNSNDLKLDKIEGETTAELDFRTMAQGQKLLSERIPGIEELPLPDSATVRSLVKEIKSKHAEIGYTDQEIAEHISHGAWGYRSYELRNTFTKEEYAVRTETIPAADIDIYGPKRDVNTVKVGGVEGRDIHNFDLHIPAGQQQVLEILHGAKVISRPLKGDHMGKSIDALEIFGGGIGFTGTASDTVKPVLKQAGFTKFDYGQVKASDYEVPVINPDLSRTVKDVTDSIINNRGDRLDIDLTPNNPLSRLIKKVLTTQGVKPAVLAKNGENFKFVEGKYVHIGGRTPERAAQALLDSLKTEKAPYAIVGTANLIGRGLNFDPAPYLAKANTKVVVNLIEPELMTATQVLQGAGRIGGKYRFANIKDDKGNIYNPEKSVRLLMSREMMRPMAEFKDVLSLADSKAGIKNLRIMDALQDVWNRNERDVVSRSGLSAERLASNKVKSEFKEMDIPLTIEAIEKNVAGIGLQDYLLSKGFVTEHTAQNSQAQATERRLTVNGLRFMQLFKEVESLSDEQFKMLDRIKAIQLLHIDDPVELAKGLAENKFVELENYNTKGLTSVISLARVLKPFNTDLSSAEFNDYQNIISGTVEQKLEFFKGLIDKNKIKIDDSNTRELILNKLGRQKQSWDKIQEISRQISSSYGQNNSAKTATGILQLKSAYREFENIVTYKDLENIRVKLNSPAITDLIPWFIPNAGTDELAKFSAVFDFAKTNKINLASQNLFELLDLTNQNKKADFARFVDKNTKDPALKIYAQRVAIYHGALEKQTQYFTQLWSGKKIDIKDYEQGLHEDIEFLNNFNIDPTQDFQLNLAQLRG